MSKIAKSSSISFHRDNNSNDQDRSLILEKAVEDVESFYMQEKEGSLYRFLLSIVEKPLIENALYKTEGNQLKAAKLLGINRNTLHAKIQKLKINIEDIKCLTKSKDK